MPDQEGLDVVAENLALQILSTEKKPQERPLPVASKHKRKNEEYARARSLKILELRVQGYSFNEIAEMLEYRSGKHVQSAYTRLMDKQERENTQHLRNLQHERLEMAWRGLAPKIEQGRERAVEVGIKVLERQARLQGIDIADEPAEKTTSQPIQINIMAHPGDPRAQAMIIDQEPKQLEESKGTSDERGRDF